MSTEQGWNISEWSIKKPIPTIVLFIVLTLMGIVSFNLLGIDEDPKIDFPLVSVTVSQPGAAPSELETQITKRVEDSVASLGGIEAIRSTIVDGASVTAIEFAIGTDTDRAVNDVRNAVTKIRQDLPQDILEPIIERIDFAGDPFITYTVSSDQRTVDELSWFVDNDLARALLSVRGVSQVVRSGGVTREVRIDLDPNRLKAVGITADQVNQQVRNLNANLPGGRGDLSSSEQTIRTLGSAPTVEALRATRIPLSNGTTARLDTLGTIVDGFTEVRQLARLNGKPVVAFSVTRSKESNLVSVEKGIEEKIAELEQTIPQDIELKLIRNTRAEFTKDSYFASIEALILGAVLAMLVIYAFLRDWRSTLIATVAMPLSLIPTFAVLQAVGYTLNSMTLLGLALVVGVLVDDAIVEIENVERHLRMGKTAFQAALDASAEIGLAVVATTMAIVAVFFPVAFMTGIPGQFFRPFGITVAVSVLFSLLVARTITPLLAAYLLKELPRHSESEDNFMVRPYAAVLGWSLRNPLPILLGGVAFFAASCFLLTKLPTSFFTQPDRGEISYNIELPPGATLAETEKAVNQATAIIQKRPEVVQIFSRIGSSGINKASLDINLIPKGDLLRDVVQCPLGFAPKAICEAKKRTIPQRQFEEELRGPLSEVPGVRLEVSAAAATGAGKPLSITLVGDNPVSLSQAANDLEAQMRGISGLVDVTSSASLQNPEIQIQPDFERAAEQGVSVATIARTAKIATLGDIDSNLAKFNLADRQIPIRIQFNAQARNDLQALGDIQIVTKSGSTVPLRAVASLTLGSGSSKIERYNRARQIIVGANLNGLALGSGLEAVKELPAFRNLPPDVQEKSQGDTKVLAEIFGQFILVLLAAVVFIYAVLVLLFSDFIDPLTIMVALPLSLGGAVIGLLVFGKNLDIYAIIGILMLMGLVTKNSILLVEYSILSMRGEVYEGDQMAQPISREEAILKAGQARVQPIMMTTIAMIAGMLPIALSIGAGSEVRSPMAVAVVGGLITSTLLTLVVVPVVFNLVGQLRDRLQNNKQSNTPTGMPVPAQQQE